MSEQLEERIDWEKGGGLVPAIVQDRDTLQVLMLGYCSPESLAATRESGKVTFFSRSKQRLWQKGEESGHVLVVASIELDCDGDTLLIRARPAGPTCHRGTISCFDEASEDAASGRVGIGFLGRLERIIEARAEAPNEASYTRRLLDAGIPRMAQKVGEEGVEVALAAATGDTGGLPEEAADLLYHLLVLLKATDLRLEDVTAVLERRHQQS